MSSHQAEQELRHLGIRLSMPPQLTASTSKLSAMLPKKLRRSSCGVATAGSSQGCFGRPLSEQPVTLVDEADGTLSSVPSILASCCEYLAQHLLTTEGLFRVEGAKLRQRELRDRLQECVGQTSYEIPDGTPPQDVCAVLKAWLRELPQPLLPPALAKALSEAASAISEPERRRHIVRLACRVLLPSEGRQARALSYLCQFLARVAAASSLNRMDSGNLATCLGPSLYGGATSAEAAAQLNSGVALLIDFAQGIETNSAATSDSDDSSCQRLQLPQPSQQHRRRSSGFKAAVTRVVARIGRSRSRSPHLSAAACEVITDVTQHPPSSKRRRVLHRLSCPSEALQQPQLQQQLKFSGSCKRRSFVASPHPEFRRPRGPAAILTPTSASPDHQPRRPQPPPPPMLAPMLLKAAAAVAMMPGRQQQPQQQQSVGPLKAVHHQRLHLLPHQYHLLHHTPKQLKVED